jgi:hypothetical protein
VQDHEIRSLVRRLARPHRSGGATIERAAILAEGADFTAVIAWITARDGTPEAPVAAVPKRGLYASRTSGAESRTVSRYILPPGALD